MKRGHERHTPVRLQTTSDADKAFTQLGQMIRRGKVVRAVIIAEYPPPEGDVHVQGMNAPPSQMASLLLVAAKALEQIPPEAQRNAQGEARVQVSPLVRASGMDIHTLAHQWATFEAAVFSVSTSPIQRSEMRKAFYSGAQALFGMMLRAQDAGDDATEQDLARMDGWKDELDRFAAELLARA